jgi:hypothetical protein
MLRMCANRPMGVTNTHPDRQLLLNAAESYQRTKDLMSVIEIDAEQTSQFQERLAALQARLLGRT